jgi:very-long-chain enoyl-CoA reductase
MPIRNLYKNSAHYWLLSGVVMAYGMYCTSWSTGPSNQILNASGLALYGLGEMLNLQIHLTLQSKRSAGGKERWMPEGMLFDLVTCPNYFTEIIAWIGMFMLSGFNWSFVPFLVAALGQMGIWAKQKERRYRDEFGAKYQKKRYCMFPGIW